MKTENSLKKENRSKRVSKWWLISKDKTNKDNEIIAYFLSYVVLPTKKWQ